MQNTQGKPVREPHAQWTLKGYDDIPDLPVTHVEYPDGSHFVVSVWKFGWRDRLRWLFDGRVNMHCMGKTHPPVSITIGKL